MSTFTFTIENRQILEISVYAENEQEAREKMEKGLIECETIEENDYLYHQAELVGEY